MMQRNAQREAEKESTTKVVDQGSQTRGPHVARRMRLCGSRAYQKVKKLKMFSNLAYFEGFSCKLRPAKSFF
jgi:hypothetical protein